MCVIPTRYVLSLSLLIALSSVWPCAPTALAQDEGLSLKAVEKEAPQAIAKAIQAVLDNKVIQLVDAEGPVFEYWFRKAIPLQNKPTTPGGALDSIKETTLLGVLKLHKPFHDFRDDKVDPGVYTMRLGLRPDDGDHMGVSFFSYFALLVPAERDRELEGIKSHHALSVASMEDTAGGHPRSVSLEPLENDSGEFPRLESGSSGSKLVYLKLSATAAGDPEPFAIVLGLVYEGTGEV